MKRFFGIISDGKLPPAISNSIRKCLQGMEGKKACIEIKEGNRRSTQQNAFYWGVVIETVKQMFEDAGQPVTPDEVHCYLKEHVAGMVKVITLPDGTRQSLVETSTKLSKGEWEGYILKIRAWAEQFDCNIPEPNEMNNYLFNQGE